MITYEIKTWPEEFTCKKCGKTVWSMEKHVMRYSSNGCGPLCLKCGHEMIVFDKKQAFEQFERLEKEQVEIEKLL